MRLQEKILAQREWLELNDCCNLLEGNMVCPGRPDLQIDELRLWAWTEQESHACNYQARQCLFT